MSDGWSPELIPFIEVLELCRKKLQEKRPQYGDSWRTAPLDFLDRRLQGEFREYLVAQKPEKVLEEIVDIIDVALMIGQRTIWILEDSRRKDAEIDPP